jgi:glycosyltransferase involved in cell wall biosynthesis
LVGPRHPNPAALSPEAVEGWVQEGAIEYGGATLDVRPFLREASVYVLPSYREGMPLTVLEAMATGRPIITTDAPGCRETVVDGSNGFLVPVGDAKVLAARMERFLVDPTLAARMGRESRVLAEAKFDARRVDRAIIDALLGLA